MISTSTRTLLGLTLAAFTTALPAVSAQAVPLAPGYSISQIPTPGVATGGVVVQGGAVLVGVGPFGGATQSIVRIENGTAVTIADGFNSLAGFHYDSVNDRLLVGDNGLGQPGGTTGDTVYAVPNPFTTLTPHAAAGIELLPAGSFASVSDIILDPNDPTGNTAIVSDADFPAGRVVSVDLTLQTQTDLQTPLQLVAGLVADATTLYVGELVGSFPSFTGQIRAAALPSGSDPLAPLIDSMAGQVDLVLDSAGNLLSTSSAFGGASELLRIDPVTGAILETVATDFDFAGALDEQGTVMYVVEGGFSAGNRVWVLNPVPEPGTFALVAMGLAGFAAKGRRGARR